ncbi:hypothetical protein KKG45_00740 [bacterium]|nr:hypothetical protein [bacterium]MBU1071752.1 hypothetical protein [bacterium]
MSAFRKVCLWLHRELGFFAVGLTLVYAISGIAVNHLHHWDPNHASFTEAWSIESPGTGETAEVAPLVLARLALAEPVKETWRAGRDLFQVFVDDGTIDVNLATGEVVRHGHTKRPLFFDVNFMHLNKGRAPWTGIADAYAGVLIVLALTGIFLVKGRKGLAGRGGVLMGLGLVLPLVYAVAMRLSQP